MKDMYYPPHVIIIEVKLFYKKYPKKYLLK